jgi:hypothetical protein
MAKSRKKATRGEAEAPTSSCLVICDEVLVSVAHGKHLLQGVINEINVPVVPIALGPFAAYIRLTNVYGGSEIRISLCKADDDEDVFAFPAKAPEVSSPLQSHTLIIRIPPFAIEESGRYIFSASHAGVPFAQSPIQINVVEPPKEEP